MRINEREREMRDEMIQVEAIEDVPNRIYELVK